MTVRDLISKLSSYPAGARVTLLDPDKGWLLPIEITQLSADASSCGVDLIAITADSASDEIEGLAKSRPSAVASLQANSSQKMRAAKEINPQPKTATNITAVSA